MYSHVTGTEGSFTSCVGSGDLVETLPKYTVQRYMEKW